MTPEDREALSKPKSLHGKGGQGQRRPNAKRANPYVRGLMREAGLLPARPNEHIRNNRQKHNNSDGRREGR